MTSTTTKLQFASKVDWWIAAIVISVPVISLGTAIASTVSGDTGAAITGWITVAAILALYVGVVWPVEYEVGGGELLVRYGFVRTRIPLDQITTVKPSRNPLASPALSLDRIRLDRHGGGFVLVSPADRGRFVVAIFERARHVEIDPRLGDGLRSPRPASLRQPRPSAPGVTSRWNAPRTDGPGGSAARRRSRGSRRE